MKIFNRADTSDMLAFSGLAMAGAGLWMISLPLALVVVGAVLFGLGLFTAFPRGAKQK
jgi:hypothetical protein